MKRKVISAVIAGTIALTTMIPAIPANAAPTNGQIQIVQEAYSELDAKVRELEEKVEAIDAQINPLAEKINANNKEVDDINKEIDNTKKEIEQSKLDIAEKEVVLGDRLRELYKNGGQTSYLSIIFSANSFTDLISKIDSAGRLINLDKKIVKDLTNKKDKLDAKVVSLDEKSKDIKKITEETEKQKAELDKKREEQQVFVDEAAVKRAEYEKENLIPLERDKVKNDINICYNSSSSLDDLISARDRLRAVRKSEIKSPTVDKEVVDAIENAKMLIAQKEEEERNNNRGPGLTVNGSSNAILNEAYKHLGKAYVFGAKGPNTFDCSGFTSYVYRHAAGIEIGGSTYSQINAGREVSYSQLQPGDLVFPHADHVGIYIGGGQMVHAPRTGDVVKIAPVWKFWRARRILN